MTDISAKVYAARQMGWMLSGLVAAISPPEQLARRTRKVNTVLSKAVVDLVALLKPATVLEVGCHEATFSRTIKGLLPESRVVAFEADPVAFGRYEADAKAAGVEFLPLCVASSPGTRSFSMPLKDGAPRAAMGSLMLDSAALAHQTYEVEATTLDVFLGEAAAGPSAMWVDVEGGVGEVLAGGDAALRGCQAFYIELETKQRWGGQMLDTGVIERLAEYDLTPVLRDIQRPWQYNCLFLKAAHLENPVVEILLRRALQRMIKTVCP